MSIPQDPRFPHQQQPPYVPGGQPPTGVAPVPPPAPSRKRRVWPWLVGGIGLLVLCVLCSGIIAAFGPDQPSKEAAVDQTATVTAPAAPATSAKASPTAKPATAPKPTTAAPKPPPKAPKPPAHKAISDRTWLLIAKNPDAHIGERIIVHGEVFQFDSATGDGNFLAYVGGKRQKPSYGFVDYDTNTMFVGTTKQLRNVVEGDLFTASVTVTGSLDYDTQIGGATTVPLLQIDSIKVTGSTS